MFQAVVFVLAHHLLVFLLLVFKAAEVQHTMENDPVQLVLVRGLILYRVLLYPVYADIYLALHVLLVLAEIEGNDVGKGIVIKEILVHLQEEGIVAEDVAELC